MMKLASALLTAMGSLALATPLFAGPLSTQTPTATATATATPTATATATATATPIATATATPPATATPLTPTGTATATSTVTGTPTATPIATPTPNMCGRIWPSVTINTIGKGQSPSNNIKVFHEITGHIQNPSALGDTAHRIPICPGTSVTAQVRDLTGSATNRALSANVTCDGLGCSVTAIQGTEKYISRSRDGTDADRMTFILAK